MYSCLLQQVPCFFFVFFFTLPETQFDALDRDRLPVGIKHIRFDYFSLLKVEITFWITVQFCMPS